MRTPVYRRRGLGDAASDAGQRFLVAQELVDRLAAPDYLVRRAADQDLGGARPGVVVGGHREAVGAGGADAEQLAALEQRQLAVAGEEVAALADRTDHIDRGA